MNRIEAEVAIQGLKNTLEQETGLKVGTIEIIKDYPRPSWLSDGAKVGVAFRVGHLTNTFLWIYGVIGGSTLAECRVDCGDTAYQVYPNNHQEYSEIEGPITKETWIDLTQLAAQHLYCADQPRMDNFIKDCNAMNGIAS